MKKITAHKNECPVSAGQIVKSISKSATQIIAAYARFMTLERTTALLVIDVALVAGLVACGGAL